MPPGWLVDLYNKVLDFRWIEASFGLYTTYVPWFMFYTMLWAVVLAITYLKTRDVTVLGLVSALTGAFFAGLLPGEAQFVGGLAVLVGLASLLYRLIRS